MGSHSGWHLLVSVSLGWLLASCQTGAPQEAVVLPKAMQALFGDCAPNDGGAALQLFKEGQVRASMEANWLTMPGGDWDVEMSDPLGKTLLRVQRRAASLKLIGPMAASAPEFAINDAGIITLSGHPVGIKASEVPCLLRLVYPKPWLATAVGTLDLGGQSQWSFSEPKRKMRLTAAKAKPATASCATVTWREYLVFNHALTWCVQGQDRRRGSLSGLQGFKLTWVPLEDG